MWVGSGGGVEKTGGGGIPMFCVFLHNILCVKFSKGFVEGNKWNIAGKDGRGMLQVYSDVM